MADEKFGIAVEIDPSKAIPVMGRVDGALDRTEQKVRRVGKTIGEEYAKAAREGERAAAALERAQAKAARAGEQAATKAARATMAAARDAARAQEEHARHVTMTIERQARERAAAEAAAYRQTVAAARAAAQQQEAAARQASRAAAQAARQQGGGVGGAVTGSIAGYLAPAAAVATAATLGREILQLGDSYQTLTNRLATLTGSEAAAIPLREKLLDLANETRTANGPLVDLYARIAGSVKELGVSQAATLEFTAQLAKSFRVSGASTVAQAQAMVQLSQGLGAGALRGEEFNSVLEAAPNIIDIVGAHIGKTRGEMRAMAEDGKLTTATIIDAFAAAGDEIDAKFSRNVATSSDLMVVFKNEIERSVGALMAQADVLPALAEGFGFVGAQVRSMTVELGKAVDAFKMLNDAGLTGGFLKSDGIRGALFGNIFTNASGAQDMVTGWLGGPTDDLIAGIKQKGAEVEKALREEEKRLAQRDKLLAEQQAKFDRAEKRGYLTGFLGQVAPEAFDKYDAFLKRKEQSELDRILGRDRGSRVAKAEREIADVGEALDGAAAQAVRFWSAIGGAFDGAADTAVSTLSDVGQAARLAAQKSIYDDVYGAGIKYSLMLEAVRAELDRGALSTDQYAAYVERLRAEYAGTADSLTRMYEAAGKAGGDDGGMAALTDALGEVGAGLFDLEANASKSFEQIASNAAAAAARILAEFAILSGVKAIFGADSSAASFVSQLFNAGGFAGGGGFTVPNGGGGTDSVPVYFRATPGERVRIDTPGQQVQQGSPTQVTVPVSVHNAIDHTMIAAALDTPAGHSAVINIIDRYVGALSNRVGSSS